MTDTTLSGPKPVDPLFAEYRPSGAVDEVLDEHGRMRPHWQEVVESYAALGRDEVVRRADEIALLLEQDGVTYNQPEPPSEPGTEERSAGRTPVAHRGGQRPWKVDPIPVVVEGREWATLASGVEQRARLLDTLLDDLYGERRLLRSGRIPAAMLLQDPQFLRECDGIRTPAPHQLVTVGTDLVRDRSGQWSVLGHRAQVPSGSGYAIETRRVVARVLPRMYRQSRVRRLTPFLRALQAALRAAAPVGVDDPTIVILSSGPLSETAFEHASMAALLGYPLVQGADLEVHQGRVHLRTISGLTPVHVILRRVDAWFCDPLELRADSTLGVAGLVDACRTGRVSVVNPLGAGVLENAGLVGLLPELCRDVLGEDPILSQTESWWCGDDAERSHVLSRLGHLVVRPLSRAGLEHATDTTRLTGMQLDELRHRIEAHPDRWVGQERVEPGTAPVLGAGGRLESRATVLRAFAVARGDGYEVMDGGLARSAGADPEAPVANRAGALAKDVWVLGGGSHAETGAWLDGADEVVPAGAELPAARAAEQLFWLGRYVERAEFTVRLLRSVLDRRNELQDASVGPAASALTTLLETLTRVTGTAPGLFGIDLAADDPGEEIASLLLDGRRPGTVAHAVDRVFDAIDIVRDQLSVDTWLVAGSLQQILESARTNQSSDGESAPSNNGPGDDLLAVLLDELLPGLLSFAGLGAESMVRDHAWRFMDAGRRLERATMLASLIGASLEYERSPAVESLVIESVLSAAESIITYRRRYRSWVRVARVVDLLVVEPDNPRSMRFQLDRLARRLAELRQGLGDGDEPTQTEASLARLIAVFDNLDTTRLASTDESGHRQALAGLMSSVEGELRAVSDALTTRYFVRAVGQHAVSTPVEPRTFHW